MNKGRGVLTLILIFWVIFSLVSFLENGHKIIGKSFVTSEEFQSELQQYYEQLYEYVLISFDATKLKEQIKVDSEEIQYYRNYYGSLEEQVENVASQYKDRIQQNEDITEEVKEVLIQERNRKIDEIKKNFSDDAYVEKKIRSLKEQIIDQFVADREARKREFVASNLYKMFSYDLINIETGQRFHNNSIDVPTIFEERFEEENGVYFSPYTGQHYMQSEQTQTSNTNGRSNSAVPKTVMDTEIYFHDNFDESYALLYHSIPVTLEHQMFTGVITIPKSGLKNAELKGSYEGFETFKVLSYILWSTGLAAIVILCFFSKPRKEQIDALIGEYKPLFSKLPIDIAMVATLCAFMLFGEMLTGLVHSIYNIAYFRGEYYNWINIIELLVQFAVTIVLFIAIVKSSMWLIQDLREIDRWKKSFALRFWQVVQDLFLNRSIGIQTASMFIIFFLAGVGFTGAMVEQYFFILYVPLFFFVLIPTLFVFLRRMGYLNRVMMQTQDMAEGRLTSDIIVKGKSPIAEHAKNLNKLRDGVRKSMTEQAKSERLKTELITNVSHDLRTPLTSIITYTDLLKKTDITEEERTKYIAILDKKSARLKTLIEDLFDVSKMASGNVELLKQRVDLAQLLQQAVAEHEEAFITANLDMRIHIESQPIFAYVDGQKWWRMIDNLIINAQKYSLPGTRVYITLKQQGAEAELVVKNVAKYELTENADELIERFKRADTSRHTEGSGLGLAIAQSIVDLHDARMKIDVDGDLFKVTVAVQAAF